MPSRRFHPKTRHGCKQCKARKVKCDAARPKCANCSRRRHSCDYEIGSWDVVPMVKPSPANTLGTIRLIKSDFGITTHQVELLHHFSYAVGQTVTDAELQHTWKLQCINRASSQPFLMHAILAFSAIHLSEHQSLGTSQHYRLLALQEHGAALVGMRPSLQNLTPANFEALFVATGLVAMFRISTCNSMHVQGTYSAIDDLLEIRKLVNGPWALLKQTTEALKIDSVEPMIELVKPKGNGLLLGREVDAAICAVESLVISSVPTRPSREVYIKALTSLRDAWEVMRLNSGHESAVLIWLLLPLPEFIRMVGCRDPIALVILAHYGVMLHEVRHVWMFSHWGRNVVTSVFESLDPAWHFLLEWAVETVNATPKAKTTEVMSLCEVEVV